MYRNKYANDVNNEQTYYACLLCKHEGGTKMLDEDLLFIHILDEHPEAVPVVYVERMRHRAEDNLIRKGLL